LEIKQNKSAHVIDDVCNYHWPEISRTPDVHETGNEAKHSGYQHPKRILVRMNGAKNRALLGRFNPINNWISDGDLWGAFSTEMNDGAAFNDLPFSFGHP
jgi:hypothetical protein